MRISLDWLKQYVDIEISADALAERLTMVGLEVESVERLGEKYDRFFVGEVLKADKHPKADRLTVCSVSIGKETLQIVCGAPNVAAGQKVVVGTLGATVPRNQHYPDGRPFVLSQVKLRGVDSYGMICSGYELDFNDDKDGILILSGDAVPGQPYAGFLGLNDTVLNIGVTPNRPDALSHIGVAREVAAFLGKQLRIPSFTVSEAARSSADAASIMIDAPEDCPRYSGRVMTGVSPVQSPAWMQQRLTAVGIRPINAVVDVTNYVLMECGHPLHAFDYDKLHGHSIIVRRAKAGEPFTTLDHKSRVLRNDTLMICDGAGPVAVAGVMGGENSEISDVTRNILIESAWFDPVSVRRTSKYLGISTEASQRFERGADPSITVWAVDRAASLIKEIAGGEILRGVIDCYPGPLKPKCINLRVGRAGEILGISVTAEKVRDLLGRIGIACESSGASPDAVVHCTPPTFRPDLEREIDLIEEVARLYGYEKIPTNTRAVVDLGKGVPPEEFGGVLRTIIAGAGFHEIVVNSMQDREEAAIASEKFVTIANPISREMSSLRTSLIPGALQIVRNNLNHSEKNLRLFEIGSVYFNDPQSTAKKYVANFVEEERILLLMTGVAVPRTWDQAERQVDLMDLRGELESLFNTIFLDNINFIPYSTTKALTEHGLSIEINGEYIGSCGAVRHDIASRYEIEQGVYVVELSIGVLERLYRPDRTFIPLPRYPSVTRDLALVVDETVKVGDLMTTIREAGRPLLSSLGLFDVYRGNQVGSGKASYAFACEFLSEDKTLSTGEVDGIVRNIIGSVARKHGASIRQ